MKVHVQLILMGCVIIISPRGRVKWREQGFFGKPRGGGKQFLEGSEYFFLHGTRGGEKRGKIERDRGGEGGERGERWGERRARGGERREGRWGERERGERGKGERGEG